MDSPAFLGLTPATKQFLPLAYSWHFSVWNWPGFAGNALCDDLGVFIDEDRHIRAPPYLTAATIFWAASAILSALMMGRPLSASIFLPSSSLVPFMRTTSGTLRFTRLAGRDHASGNGVALHDSAKDIDQNGLDLGVLEHDLEGFGHFLGSGAATHVQEVCGLGAKQLDGVHRCHGQTCTVHQTTDVAIQADVGQVELDASTSAGSSSSRSR
jgi:hypothetical protein